MTDYSWVTQEAFDEKFAEIVNKTDVLGIPGVYEILSEHFNNDVLEALETERETERSNEENGGTNG